MTLNFERLFFGGCALFLVVFTLIDLREDLSEGTTSDLLLQDVITAFLGAALLAYILLWPPLTALRENRLLESKSRKQAHDITRLRQVAQVHLEGLGRFIAAQFDEWRLTEAEKDVGLLLLKGFSMKEIAELRNVSERTARQQATTLYGKAGLNGRAALSAYFLEDVLLPNDAGQK